MNVKKISFALLSLIVKIAVAILIVLVLYKVSIMAYDLGYAVFAEDTMEEEPGTTKSISFTEGKSPYEIGQILQEAGLIKDAKVFFIQVMMYQKSDEFIPGQYELNTSMTSEEIIDTLTTPVETEEEE